MTKLRIGFIERKFDFYVSVEKVFRAMRDGLDEASFEAFFNQLPYSNRFSGMLRNLAFFRPDDGVDIYHVTGHCHYIALVLPPEKTVLTIHDLVFLHTRRGFRRWALKKLLLELPIRRLKYITAISEATAGEIEDNVPESRGKVRVIPNPLDDFFKSEERLEFNQSKPNILQIGTSPNKNVENVIRALEGLECNLTIIGKTTPELESFLAARKIDHTVKEGLTDDEMKNEYSTADIVVFCSTYEGFGLPIIEAQAMRKPVVTSDLSPMKEVAGDGACIVDPFDHESIRKGISEVINDSEFRDRLIENGLRNVTRFDKRAIAEQYASLYKEIVSRTETKDSVR